MKKLVFLLALCMVLDTAYGQFRKRRTTTPTNESTSSLNYSNPKEYVVGGIDITGLRVLDKNALISLSGLKVGDKVKIPGDEISGAIKKLWRHGLVGDVSITIDKIEGDQIYLIIILSERPRLTGFTFEGVRKSWESQIREDLNLIRGRILSDAILRNTQITVKNHYIQKGYLNADVKVVQSKDTVNTDGVKLRIVVDPKSKVKINKITFEGNEQFADSRLKKKMKDVWMKNGVRLAWLIDPVKQKAYIYRTDTAVEIVPDFDHVLSGEDVCEGFELNLTGMKES